MVNREGQVTEAEVVENTTNFADYKKLSPEEKKVMEKLVIGRKNRRYMVNYKYRR